MNSVRGIINNIVSSLYELADAIELQQANTDARICDIQGQSTQHKIVLQNIADIINKELR